MRAVVRTTVRLVLFPILQPIRILMRRRRQRAILDGRAGKPGHIGTSSERVRRRRDEHRREAPRLFASSSMRRPSKPSSADGVQHREGSDAKSDRPLLDPVGPLVQRTASTVSCRPAPTLDEVAEGASTVDLSWTVGPLRFEGVGFAKARGELSEDAFAGHLKTAAVALADGASTAWQAGEWALHLCGAWVGPDGVWSTDEHEARVAAIQRSFLDEAPAEEAAPSQWFADEVSRRGAFAAFLGISFDTTAGTPIPYRALSVGDVCLVQFRNGISIASFPITSSDELNSRPELIGSSVERRTIPPKESSGRLAPGDVLILASDGVAGLLLGGSVTAEHQRAFSHGPLEEVAEALRAAQASREIVDDDYTLVRVSL